MNKFKIAIISICTIILLIITTAVVYENIKYDKIAKEENKITEDRKSTRLNSSHCDLSRMPSSA